MKNFVFLKGNSVYKITFGIFLKPQIKSTRVYCSNATFSRTIEFSRKGKEQDEAATEEIFNRIASSHKKFRDWLSMRAFCLIELK